MRAPGSHPTVTLAGLVVAAGAPALAAAGGGWWLAAAAAVVVLSGLLDSLDGAVALLTGRTTRWGHVLDSVADRAGDALFVATLWVAGAPGVLCAASGMLMFLQEYARARRRRRDDGGRCGHGVGAAHPCDRDRGVAGVGCGAGRSVGV